MLTFKESTEWEITTSCNHSGCYFQWLDCTRQIIIYSCVTAVACKWTCVRACVRARACTCVCPCVQASRACIPIRLYIIHSTEHLTNTSWKQMNLHTSTVWMQSEQFGPFRIYSKITRTLFGAVVYIKSVVVPFYQFARAKNLNSKQDRLAFCLNFTLSALGRQWFQI